MLTAKAPAAPSGRICISFTLFSQFMYSLGYSLIVCPYTLDSMNSYKIIFNVIEIGLPK